jgi:hypothetical protein
VHHARAGHAERTPETEKRALERLVAERRVPEVADEPARADEFSVPERSILP